MRLHYDIVDVFTDRPFAGNQLAVVHGARDLTDAQCQALAQEFNYAETTFPRPVNAAAYVNRIFTPVAEIPFAGHPTLGTAWLLRQAGALTEDRVIQVCGAGDIGVRFDGDLVELSATPRDLVGPLDADAVTDLLEQVGLSADDLAGSVWVAGTGLTFAHVPVAQQALARAVASSRPLGELASVTTRDPFEGINLYVPSGNAPTLTVDARVFVPGPVPEDAATGSAAAGLGMALVATGRLPEGGSYEITQGVEMGRPSRLFGRVEVSTSSTTGERGLASLCHVAGRVQPVASGEITVPPS